MLLPLAAALLLSPLLHAVTTTATAAATIAATVGCMQTLYYDPTRVVGLVSIPHF